MATIDNRLIISEGSEKVFENQYIRLEAGIERKGTLILRNSTIEPCAKLGSKNGRNPVCKPGCITMGIDGKLEMDGCKVIRPNQDFLSSWNMVIKNTSFLINPCPDTGISVQSVLAPCVIAAHGKAEFEGCSFTGCTYVSGTKISSSTFTDCGSVSSENEGGYIRNCGFIHVEAVFATWSDIDSCQFQKIREDTEDDGVIFITDCKITHCSFDDVELQNGSYLVEGLGDVCVEYCQFTNCRTERGWESLACLLGFLTLSCGFILLGAFCVEVC